MTNSLKQQAMMDEAIASAELAGANSFIEKKVEETRQAVGLWKHVTGYRRQTIVSFVESALRNHTAYLKEKVEGMVLIKTSYDGGWTDGYNKAISDILALLDKEIKE